MTLWNIINRDEISITESQTINEKLIKFISNTGRK